MSDVAQVMTMHRVASARVAHEILRATDGFLRAMQKAAWLKGFFHFRTPVREVATRLRETIFSPRDAMRARSHADDSSQAKIFFTGCSRKRARRRNSRSKARESVRSDSLHRASRDLRRGRCRRPPPPPIRRFVRRAIRSDTDQARRAAERIAHRAAGRENRHAMARRRANLRSRSQRRSVAGDMRREQGEARGRPSESERREFAPPRQVERPATARAARPQPIEYVKICSIYGAGFFYIPGTDTCIKIGGWVRAEYALGETGNSHAQFISGGGGRNNRIDSTDTRFRARTVISLDVRTQTEYGTVRAYNRFGFTADSTDTATGVLYTERAFIQIAGFTFGKTQSYFDFVGGAVCYGCGYGGHLSQFGAGGTLVLRLLGNARQRLHGNDRPRGRHPAPHGDLGCQRTTRQNAAPRSAPIPGPIAAGSGRRLDRRRRGRRLRGALGARHRRLAACRPGLGLGADLCGGAPVAWRLVRQQRDRRRRERHAVPGSRGHVRLRGRRGRDREPAVGQGRPVLRRRRVQ